MSAQAEEDARLDAELAEAEFCEDCGVPIGRGGCGACALVAAALIDGIQWPEGDGE